MARPRDVVAIETEVGGCELFSSVELVRDLHDQASLTMTVGDDGAWRTIARIFAPGRAVRVFLNGLVQFTGRFEANDLPSSPQGGVIARLDARTKWSDARYRSADLKTRVTGVSIREFLLALFAPLGATAASFQLDAATERDLITGLRPGLRAPVDLEPLVGEKAKIQPGEETWTAAVRHLKRHHLMIWDGANGQIVVGAPDDTQAPQFRLQCRRGPEAKYNNVSSPRRIRDWSEAASSVEVFGTTQGGDDDPRPIRGVATDAELTAEAAASGHFNRRLLIPIDGVRTQAKAEAQARRELAARAKRKDAWEIGVDSWTFWNGQRAVPWAINTTVDVDADYAGGDGGGRYIIHRVACTLDARGAASASLALAAPGILVI